MQESKRIKSQRPVTKKYINLPTNKSFRLCKVLETRQDKTKGMICYQWQLFSNSAHAGRALANDMWYVMYHKWYICELPFQ